MSRFKGNYREIPLIFLDEEDLLIIESKARGLSFQQCLEFLCVSEDEIPASELLLAKQSWKRGRASGISTACDNLFSSMGTKYGHAASLEYLKALSSTFQLEPNVDSSTPHSGFSFNVVMPDKI